MSNEIAVDDNGVYTLHKSVRILKKTGETKIYVTKSPLFKDAHLQPEYLYKALKNIDKQRLNAILRKLKLLEQPDDETQPIEPSILSLDETRSIVSDLDIRSVSDD